MSMIFQIQNGLKKNFSESDIYDAVIKSILPDLSLRSYLEGNPDMSIASLSKVFRSRFKEPRPINQFTALSNSRQTANELAQEYVMMLMSLLQKILFATMDESCSYSEELIQNCFTHAVLIGLWNENIRNELRPILKLNSLSDQELLENLSLTTSDEYEHSDKFNET